MANNDSAELLAKLSKLSKREKEVLHFRCLAWDYEMIAKELFITKKAVKTYMDRIYNKLELKGYGRAARLKLLYEQYCPLLQRLGEAIERPPTISDAATTEKEAEEAAATSISPEDEKILDEDEHAIVLVTPASLVPPQPGPKPRRWGLRGLIVGVVLGICLGAGGLYLLLWPPGGRFAAVPQPSPTSIPPTSMVADTTAPSSIPEVPTQTPRVVVVTATQPQATAGPTATTPPSEIPFIPPADGILFRDNFDSGLNSAWKPANGNWITANGRLTIVYEDFKFMWLRLDSHDWQNYRVSADLDRSAGQIEIAVRDQSLAYLFGFYGRNCWIYVGSDVNPDCIAGELDWDGARVNMTLEANGNEFVAFLDGMETQRLTINAAAKGGVSVGIYCQRGFECPSVDDFEVMYLP